MEINGKKLVEGKLYLWEVAKQQGSGVELNSVFFITDEGKRVYEVAFTRANSPSEAGGWYFIERQTKIDKEIPEAEIVEEVVENDDPNTLSVRVSDELKLGELLSGG